MIYSEFDKNFKKSYNDECDEGYFLEVIFNIWETTWSSQWFTIFTWKNRNWKSRKAYYELTWLNMLFT